ncbi:MAG: cytochrome c family protein [Acidobacteriota bacterium]|nr:cytochrome c family protein [Acidobacteriota bacterium]
MSNQKSPLIFPPWLDAIRPVVGAVAFGVVPVYLVLLVWFGASPKTTDVGYQPEQPVPYSHAVHAGELGIDCRYCHSTVEESAHASIPPTSTCMNCHSAIHTESEKLEPVRASYESGLPVHWIRVHDLPDYAYFNHSAHVRRGVGCVSCHGRIDTMEVVQQDQPLSMGWCLDCHRNPAPNLRPLDKITDMTWKAGSEEEQRQLQESLGVEASEDCSTCHR